MESLDNQRYDDEQDIIQKERKELPIYEFKNQIISIVKNNLVSINLKYDNADYSSV